MSAEPLDNTPAQQAGEALVEASITRVYSLVETNLGSVGGLDSAAKVAKLDRGDFRRALDRAGRYLAIDHVMRIAARMRQFNASAATLLAAAVVRPAGLLVFPLVEMPAEEKARRLEQLVRSMPLGEQLLQHALETP
jgi:hypothetical protein